MLKYKFRTKKRIGVKTGRENKTWRRYYYTEKPIKRKNPLLKKRFSEALKKEIAKEPTFSGAYRNVRRKLYKSVIQQKGKKYKYL